MRRSSFLLATLAGLLLAPALASSGCGNTVIEIKPNDGGGGEGGGSPGTGGDNISDAGADAKDALPDYKDPGCPDAPPANVDLLCDPFDQDNGDCFDGEGCYIYVQYPDEPCEQETYGSYCAPAGTGKQGDSCGGGAHCAAGFDCVITGFGTQCVQLCPLSGNSGCPPGYTCEAIDVEGFGGCF